MSYDMLYEPADIIIHVQGKGIVLREKSLIAVRKDESKIVAVGTEAEAWREAEDVMVLSPFRQGVIADYSVAEILLSRLLTKALGKRSIFRKKPAIAVCVPKGITPAEKVEIMNALIQARAGKVFMTENPVDRFIREFPEKFPAESGKFRITVGITKEEPERYVEERLKEVLAYAAQENISRERVCELFQRVREPESSERTADTDEYLIWPHWMSAAGFMRIER